MPNTSDFDRAWLARFAHCLDEIGGETIRRDVMRDSEGLSAQTSRRDVIEWTRCAMSRLESSVDETRARAIMTGCACRYPTSGLQEIRETYARNKDADLAHRMLQERFETFLRDTLQLDDRLIDEIVRLGWGLAGIKQGNTVIATKIPKSGSLAAYMQEQDPQTRRQMYCHCPRVRVALKTEDTLPVLYCYCGAGFYKGIWQEIVQEPVTVEVLDSVLVGGDVCRVAIHLPT